MKFIIIPCFVVLSTRIDAQRESGDVNDAGRDDVTFLQGHLSFSNTGDSTPDATHINTLEQSKAEEALSSLQSRNDRGQAPPPEVLERPGYHPDTPDQVKFGIALKKWYGLDLAAGTFDAEVVVTLQWSDPRTARLLPAGKDKIRLNIEKARGIMWLPDIEPINTANDGFQMISSSILIESNGAVTKVEDLLLTLKQSFKTRHFPFDEQDVRIFLASQTYMSSELQLEPLGDDTLLKGASAELFSNSIWSFLNASLMSYVEEDAMLQKSQGVLTLTVKRGCHQYQSSIFVPSIIFLLMTWSGLWLPLAGPYVMPRVAINAFALLCQVSIGQTANSMVPATGERAWMTEYLELCVELQFLVMLINLFAISIDFKSGGKTLARILNNETIISYPITTTINITILWYEYFQLSRTVSIISICTYISYLSFRYWFDEEIHAEAAKQ